MLLAYILQSVVPLVVPRLSAVAIIVPTIVILPIVFLVTTVIVITAIVVAPTIIVPSAIVVIAPVVFVAVVIVLPITVVISISFAGTGPLGVYRSWSNSSSRLLRSLWLNLSDSYGIAVEQVIFAQF